jgi:hypothetical protein
MANSKCRGGNSLGAAPFAVDLGGRVRLLLIGHGRHGKDSVGDILRDSYGLRSVSSSEFAAQKAVFPLVSDLYADWRAAYEDRHAHRDLWFHAIRAYNLRPGPMLAEQILEGHDIYTGMRSRAEFDRARRLFDLVVWVDASRRLPPEPGGSMELTAADADLVIDNNGAADALPGEVAKFVARVIDGLEIPAPFSRRA